MATSTRIAAVWLARALAVLLVFGVAFSPVQVLAVHSAATLATDELVHHADHANDGLSDHGHSHGDGDTAEREPGHLHGHDPADHSHQLAFAPPDSPAVHRALGRNWLTLGQTAVRLGPDPGFERPPRGVLST